jgi:monovalent cation/proton antiporter MnhG/PhaG subunit
MPDLPRQLHAAGLITGPATIAILLAALATDRAEIITSAVLVVVFVLITAPLSSHAIARAAHERPSVEPGDGDPDSEPR